MSETRCEEDIPFLIALPLLQKLLFSGGVKEKNGLTKTQLYILTILSHRDSATMKEIAGYIASSSEQATRAVAPLADAGYLERFVIPSNRSHTHIRLTASGRDFILRLREEILERAQARLAQNTTPAERERLSRAMADVIEILGKAV